MVSRILPKIGRIAARAASSKPMLSVRSARFFVSASTPLFEKHTMKVPTMGDSITEGTIVEWTAAVGQMVKEGDVVALVETDKVTVDIKADLDGVVTQHFGEVDDTVEVGADLYDIDTEAEASMAAPAEVASPAPVPEEPARAQEEPAPTVAAVSESKPQHRNPSIKFLGKEGWGLLRSGQGDSPVLYALPANYGRPKFSDDEIDALIAGGANLAPDVKKHSAGALFGF